MCGAWGKSLPVCGCHFLWFGLVWFGLVWLGLGGGGGDHRVFIKDILSDSGGKMGG